MLRRTLMVLALAQLTGCYDPTPAPGAYRCALTTTGNDTCPTGQSCVCGLCVNHASQAACTFKVDATQNGGAPTVNEHAGFNVTITAQTTGGATASDFAGNVSLAFVLNDGSPWCDVTPSTVPLVNGKATVQVSLNRETIPPQAPVLQASFFGNTGLSGPINVVSPDLSRDVNPVIGPVSTTPFGWANASIAQPEVKYVGGQWRIFFAGTNVAGTKDGIGDGTSTDGIHFTAMPAPILTTQPGAFYSATLAAPALLQTASGYALAFAGSNMKGVTPPASIGLATSTDGNDFTVVNGGMPILETTSCDYCGTSVDTPSFITPQPSAGPTTLMFFSAIDKNAASIGLATSTDGGTTWIAAPSAVLDGQVGGEAILLSPHVLLDGSVYKMWYSFARLADYLSLKSGQLCDLPVYVGYATSSDTYYWVRSPKNVTSPAIGLGSGTGTTWDAGYVTFLAGAAIPTNGTDASAGISLYYSALHHQTADATSPCVADAIGRATRP